jgi:hypothetical protein
MFDVSKHRSTPALRDSAIGPIRPSTRPLPPPRPARFGRERPSGKKGRNCETNPISFKTYCPPNTNNENISLLTKSKSYDFKRHPRSDLLCLNWAFGEKTNHFFSSTPPPLIPPVAQMLPIVADALPKMLPFKLLLLNNVTDVTAFPTSYINHACPSCSLFPSPAAPTASRHIKAFESIGNRREEYGEAIGRMAAERAGASESTQAFSRLLKVKITIIFYFRRWLGTCHAEVPLYGTKVGRAC